jgi:leucyl-tRNA synthetase
MALEWDESGIQGMKRWLGRIWQLVVANTKQEDDVDVASSAETEVNLDEVLRDTILQVTADLDHRHAFNTAIAALMTLSNVLRRSARSREEWKTARDALLVMIAPLAPHIADQAWFVLYNSSVFEQKWPEAQAATTTTTTVQDASATREVVTILVNGKKRGVLELESKLMQDENKEALLGIVRVSQMGQKWLQNAQVSQVIVVAKQKMINFVIAK